MNVLNWDCFDDAEVYSDNHEIEEDQKINEELHEDNIPPPSLSLEGVHTNNDFNTHTNNSHYIPISKEAPLTLLSLEGANIIKKRRLLEI